jgi:transposase-like protein
MRTRRPGPAPIPRSAFAGFSFPSDVIVLAVRRYLRFALSYRDVEELLAERGIEVDHVTIYRWVQRFTPLLAEAARPCRHAVGDRWFVDETTSSSPGSGATSTGRSTSSARSSTCLCRHAGTSRRPAGFFGQATKVTKVAPVEVTTDQAATYPIVLEDLLPAARHPTDQYANNRVECDHGRLKSWLRPMRGLNQDRSARIVIAGHSLVQNLRRGHYEVAVEEPVSLRVAVAFAELALAI